MLAWYSSKKAAGLGPDLQMFESVISCCVNSKHFEIAGRVFEEMMIGSASSSTQKLNLKMAPLSLSKDAVEGDGSTNDDVVQSPFTPSEDIVITNPVQAYATKTVGLCCNCKGYQNAMCEYRGCRVIVLVVAVLFVKHNYVWSSDYLGGGCSLCLLMFSIFMYFELTYVLMFPFFYLFWFLLGF
ncbi:hypothetical protein P8452_65091 [Trifolium repens]|nr:hypothetical protein P8452_65091 [Trifolium repens]